MKVAKQPLAPTQVAPTGRRALTQVTLVARVDFVLPVAPVAPVAPKASSVLTMSKFKFKLKFKRKKVS